MRCPHFFPSLEYLRGVSHITDTISRPSSASSSIARGVHLTQINGSVNSNLKLLCSFRSNDHVLHLLTKNRHEEIHLTAIEHVIRREIGSSWMCLTWQCHKLRLHESLDQSLAFTYFAHDANSPKSQPVAG